MAVDQNMLIVQQLGKSLQEIQDNLKRVIEAHNALASHVEKQGNGMREVVDHVKALEVKVFGPAAVGGVPPVSQVEPSSGEVVVNA